MMLKKTKNLLLLFIVLLNPTLGDCLEISLTQGSKFSTNMGAQTSEDPWFLGLPVFLSTSAPGLIESATFKIDMGPFDVESIQPVQAGEFACSFTQNVNIITIILSRKAPRISQADNVLLQINIDRFALRDLGLGFGEFNFIGTDIHFVDGEMRDFSFHNGTWYYVTDLTAAARLKLVSTTDGQPLSNFTVYVSGYGDVPELYATPNETLPSDANGITYIIFSPEPGLLFVEEGTCLIPRIDSLDFWLLIEPPEGSEYETQTAKVTVPLRTSCDDFEPFEFEPFEDVTLELMPKSSVQIYSIYQ